MSGLMVSVKNENDPYIQAWDALSDYSDLNAFDLTNVYIIIFRPIFVSHAHVFIHKLLSPTTAYGTRASDLDSI